MYRYPRHPARMGLPAAEPHQQQQDHTEHPPDSAEDRLSWCFERQTQYHIIMSGMIGRLFTREYYSRLLGKAHDYYHPMFRAGRSVSVSFRCYSWLCCFGLDCCRLSDRNSRKNVFVCAPGSAWIGSDLGIFVVSYLPIIGFFHLSTSSDTKTKKYNK